MNEKKIAELKDLGFEVYPSKTLPSRFQWALQMTRNGQKFPPILGPGNFPSSDLAWLDVNRFQDARNAEASGNELLYTEAQKAELFDELTARAKTMGYMNLLCAVSDLERIAAPKERSSSHLPREFTGLLSAVLAPGKSAEREEDAVDGPTWKCYEVTAAGFDASTDETDDCVFWVKAESEMHVIYAIKDTGANYCGEIPSSCLSDVDFTLPSQEMQFSSALLEKASLERNRNRPVA